jgi:hypothetical protein
MINGFPRSSDIIQVSVVARGLFPWLYELTFSSNMIGTSLLVEYHATMESCSDKFHFDIPNVV